MISKAREMLNEFIPDVWIYSELVKNNKDRFFGISMFTNNHHVSDFSYDILQGEQEIPSPEKVAEIAVMRLLDEIRFSS